MSGFERPDVFFRYARQDAGETGPIVRALRAQGLEVFVDDASIREYESISQRIGHGLAEAKVLVAYYSEAYPTRPACQRELTWAYLAGAMEGDPRARIMVINPAASSKHIQPVELRDARFASRPAGRRSLSRLAIAVAERVRSLRERSAPSDRCPGRAGGPTGRSPARASSAAMPTCAASTQRSTPAILRFSVSAVALLSSLSMA